MKTGKNMSKRIVKLLIAVSVCMLLTGCVNTGAHIVPSVTIPPESTQPPEPTPSPTPEPVQVEEMADLSSAYDKNGLLIVGEEHFQQYISFKNIQVYEQCGDTFMDAVAVNEYPDTLVCALNIRFFDEDGTEIASGRVQTRDGQYVLRLENGDNTLFAQIDTDMTLTDKEFRLEYSEDTERAAGITGRYRWITKRATRYFGYAL